MNGAPAGTDPGPTAVSGSHRSPAPVPLIQAPPEASEAEDELTQEPSTQPLTEDENGMDDSMESDHPEVYGYLLPYKPKGPMIELIMDSFTVGRSVHSNLTIGRIKSLDAISKIQFALVKEKIGVFLEDRSSNGTFVNRKLVGKGKRLLLGHNDRIGMAEAKSTHFIFMHPQQDLYPAELTDKYTVAQELGHGACGTVMLGVKRDDSTQVAIKIIKKKEVAMMPGSRNNVMNEVRILRSIQHPCVIRLEDAIETEDTLYIILELADGGELFDKIIEKTKFQESEAKLYFYQIVSAVEYMHSKNIAHRDLKPENILLVSDDDSRPLIKVTDLGLSKFVDFTTHLKTFCGTPQYLAPEVLFSRVRGNGSYDYKVDMWSLGVILYILLCGCPPFNPNHPSKSLIQQVTEGEYSFPESVWGSISPEAIDLVTKLMTVDSKKRLSAAETLLHTWMQDQDVINKAKELMSVRPESPQVPPLPSRQPPGNSEEETNLAFKRPADEQNGIKSACKRPKK